MFRINDPNSGIPGSYTFTVPETGFIAGPFNRLKELVDQVRNHYVANNIPVPDQLQDKIEDAICRRIPNGLCYSPDSIQYKVTPASLSGETILQGLTSLSEMVMSSLSGKDVFVPQEVAETRAEICSKCTLNSPSGFCMGCAVGRAITNTVAKVKGNRSTSRDSSLHNCSVCGCKNEAIVHVNRNILLKGEKSETTNARPDWCWLKTEDLDQAKANLHL